MFGNPHHNTPLPVRFSGCTPSVPSSQPIRKCTPHHTRITNINKSNRTDSPFKTSLTPIFAKQLPTLLIPLLFITLCLSNANAQRIGFGLSAGSEGIQLTNEGSVAHLTDLSFNDFTGGIPFFLPGDDGVTIDLTENFDGIVVIKIEAPEHLDVNINVSAPGGNKLRLDGTSEEHTLDFFIGWAYWNRYGGVSPDLTTLRAEAREVVSPSEASIPFNAATFPMRRRTDGSTPPPPPPTPDHGDYTPPPTAEAYILVYGRLGDIPEIVQAGEYSEIISIHAEFASYGPSE